MTNTFKFGPQDLQNAINAGLIHKLGERDEEFACDLIRKSRKWDLSDKQLFWVDHLVKKAKGEIEKKPARKAEQLGDFTGVIALFEKARKHLRFPKIKVALGDQLVVLSLAGEKAKVPGSITVASEGRYGENTWFGRVTREGEFQPSAKASPELTKGLKYFGEHPAECASAHGKLTGRCCFCNRELTTKESTAVGYGPDCADHFGLPWGKTAAKAAAQEEDVGNREEARLIELEFQHDQGFDANYETARAAHHPAWSTKTF